MSRWLEAARSAASRIGVTNETLWTKPNHKASTQAQRNPDVGKVHKVAFVTPIESLNTEPPPQAVRGQRPNATTLCAHCRQPGTLVRAIDGVRSEFVHRKCFEAWAVSWKREQR